MKRPLARLAGKYRRGLTLIEIAIVILIMGILMAVSLSLIRNFALLTSTESVAKKIAAGLVLARNSAIKSNTVVYFEMDLDKESYRAYRLDRNGSEIQESNFLGPVQLPESHSLLAVASALGNKNEEGIIKLRFLPSGLGEGGAIYLGPAAERPEITVIYSPYSGRASLHSKEIEYTLEDPEWEELDVIE